MTFNILDIGCGGCPCGDVNIDVQLTKRKPENFILASAEFLPFQDNTFNIVRSSYVIEHCADAKRAIQEHVRCCKKKVVIITDNNEWIGEVWFRLLGYGRIFHKEHCYAWTIEYLNNLLKRLCLKARVKAVNLSPTHVVRIVAIFGRLPRIGIWFYRDLVAEIIR